MYSTSTQCYYERGRVSLPAYRGEYVMSGANQEHGIISRSGSPDHEIDKRFPIGTRLRILPNHACATAAQYPAYQAIRSDGTVQTWPRFYGW